MSGHWTEGLLSDSRSVVGSLIQEPLLDANTLRAQVECYRAEVLGLGAGSPVDVGLVNALSAGTLELLTVTSSAGDGERRLAQIAARYFVMSDDGDGDLSSPFGFDDDVEVFNAVVLALGQSFRRIPY